MTQGPSQSPVPVDPELLQAPAPTSSLRSTAAPQARRWRRRRIHRPARGSLYDLMHEHAGQSLFLRPVFWTDEHARILGARFRQLDPCRTPMPAPPAPAPGLGSGGPPPLRGKRPCRAGSVATLNGAVADIFLSSTTHHGPRTSAIKRLLETLWPRAFRNPRHLPAMHLYFGDRVYYEVVRAQVLWDFPPAAPPDLSSSDSFTSTATHPLDPSDREPLFSSPATVSIFGPATRSAPPRRVPMMCYIGREQLMAMRRSTFRISQDPNGAANDPVLRLQRLRSRSMAPADPDADPHLVAVFLAMAQRYFYDGHASSHNYRLRPTARPFCQRVSLSPDLHDLTLRILSHDPDTNDFILYTAVVTATFLGLFRDPFSAPDDAADPGMDIQYTRIPAWPISGLRERMGQALGHDVVGQFDPEDIKTWSDEEDEPEEETEADTPSGSIVRPESVAAATKRKREALSELVNSSFDSDSDEDDGDEKEEEDDNGGSGVGAKRRCLQGSKVGVVV